MFDNMIAKEGHKKILVAFIAFIFFVIVECGLLVLISFAAFLFLVYVYRYKYIDIKTMKKNELYAPISGKVVAIDTKGFNKTIYIDVSMCNSHILRSLDDGEATISLNRGLNLPLDSFKAKKLNERATIEYKNSSMQIISSICNESIELLNKPNFVKGEKIGTFLQGQIIINIDSSYEVLIRTGDKLNGGESSIARLK